MRLIKYRGAVLKPNYRRYGLSKVTKEIEELLLHSKHLKGRFFQLWLELDKSEKEGFLREIRLIIRRNLLGERLLLAIAQDVLGDQIQLDSHVFKYLKSRVFHGDTKALLAELQSIKEEADGRKTKKGY